jgi:DNA-binding CsgD family transcriptional regulator
MIGRGMSSREIAQEFTLSVKTIESHRQTIKHKLGLATNSQLLQYAMKWFSGGTQRS